ncbi:MAG: autotransporter-associated beta strand repeat-containing protein, partial [Pseudomonadota bacterium]
MTWWTQENGLGDCMSPLSARRWALLASAALILALGCSAAHAQQVTGQGGAGGSDPTTSGGTGGASTVLGTGASGGTGSAAATTDSGGGGGGAGVSGGSGGAGGGSGGGSGGSGGVASNPDDQNAYNGGDGGWGDIFTSGGGGGGGGGGAHALVGTLADARAAEENGWRLLGGNGGHGGTGMGVAKDVAAGGGGGAGGYGAVLTGVTGPATLSGWAGGAGGNGGLSTRSLTGGISFGSSGGAGGVGVWISEVGGTADLTLDVLGGDGGRGGDAFNGGGLAGNGGAALVVGGATGTATLSITTSSGLIGGTGGQGGHAIAADAPNGNGGAGGAGMVVLGVPDAQTTLALNFGSAALQGGLGGAGGSEAEDEYSLGGTGGSGGVGLSIMAPAAGEIGFTLTGSVSGGGGGSGGQGGGIGGDGAAAVFITADPQSRVTASLTSASLSGGDGGDGGAGGTASPVVFPGAGGAGAAGLLIQAGSQTNVSVTLAEATVLGGTGGGSSQTNVNGAAAIAITAAGDAGVSLVIDNTSAQSITGGNGGGSGSGTPGAGGAGISAQNATIVLANTTSVSGGTSTDGIVAAAIAFSGSANTLEWRAGPDGQPSLTGGITHAGSSDTFALGGATDASFDLPANQSLLSGFAAFSKTGSATWTLTGTNAAQTPWTLAQGTLSISSFAALGSEASSLTLDGGALRVTAPTQTARTVTVGVSGGTLLLALPSASDTVTLANGASGNGPLTVLRENATSGTLVLMGTSTLPGGLLIGNGMAGGSVSVGTTDPSSFATPAHLATNVELSTAGAEPSVLAVVANGTNTYTGTISGTGEVHVLGSGAIGLSGSNTFSGSLVLSNASGTGPTLSIGSAAPLADADVRFEGVGGTLSATGSFSLSQSVTIAASATGTVLVGAGEAVTLAGGLAGPGAFSKAGTGELRLTGASAAFIGQGTVAAGTLVLGDGSGASSMTLGGSLSVGDGAILSAAGGTVTGAVTVRSGGVLSAGQDSGGLSAGSLLLESGATTSVSLGTPSASNALFSVTGASAGDLTLNGTLNVTGAPGYGVGVYRIFSSAGTLTDNGLALGSVPSDGATEAALEIGTQTVDVQVTGSGGTTLQYWSANGTARGGAGTWTGTSPWLDPNGGTAPWGGQTGVFSGAAGIVDVVGLQTFGTLEFLTSGYVLQASAGSLDPGAGGRLWTEGADTVAAVSASIIGAGALTKIGAGTLVLSGTNAYSGGTVLSAGTLQVSSDANLGAASGGLSFIGGRLATTASFQSARAVSLGMGGGTFSTAAATSLTLSGDITGGGSLTKEGAGTLILTGTNTYTGGTTISAGTLQIGDGGTTGSIVGNVVNNATLIFNRSDRYVFPGTITGTGTLAITGGGTLVFETANAYSGPIAITDATLVLDPGSQSTSLFTLGDGAVLKGSGTIGGLILNAGSAVAPGYSPGTISVAGAATFAAGSVYQVDVTPQGQHDLITATGTVTIHNGASVLVVAEPGVYAAQSSYAILTTTGQLTGTFGSVT